jgi:transcription elongation factor B subunit 1
MAAAAPSSSTGPSSGEGGEADVEYIKLQSAEGHIFIIDRDAAKKASTTIANMFAPEIMEIASDGGAAHPVVLGDIGTRILEKVCSYFYYKKRYAKVVNEKIPEFDIPPEIALELLMAANFLDC